MQRVSKLARGSLANTDMSDVHDVKWNTFNIIYCIRKNMILKM